MESAGERRLTDYTKHWELPAMKRRKSIIGVACLCDGLQPSYHVISGVRVCGGVFIIRPGR